MRPMIGEYISVDSGEWLDVLIEIGPEYYVTAHYAPLVAYGSGKHRISSIGYIPLSVPINVRIGTCRAETAHEVRDFLLTRGPLPEQFARFLEGVE